MWPSHKDVLIDEISNFEVTMNEQAIRAAGFGRVYVTCSSLPGELMLQILERICESYVFFALCIGRRLKAKVQRNVWLTISKELVIVTPGPKVTLSYTVI